MFIRVLFILVSAFAIGCSSGGDSAYGDGGGNQGAGDGGFEALDFTSLTVQLFQNDCLSCHSGASPRAGVDLSSYQLTRDNYVSLAEPSDSRIIKVIESGRMPPRGYTEEEAQRAIDLVLSWIDNGALE